MVRKKTDKIIINLNKLTLLDNEFIKIVYLLKFYVYFYLLRLQRVKKSFKLKNKLQSML